MKLFLDTNILIDVVANRTPWVEDALVIFELANQKQVELIAADCSFINIAYITRKIFSAEELNSLLADLREFVDVAEVGTEIIDAAISANWNDFEDCVQSMVAQREKVDYIITRNEKDFRDSNVPAISPREFLSFFRQ